MVAFGVDIISVERLMEVVTTPFMYLLQDTPEDGPESVAYGMSVEKLHAIVFPVWYYAAGEIFCGVPGRNATGDVSFIQRLPPKKQTLLVQELEKSGFFKVRPYFFPWKHGIYQNIYHSSIYRSFKFVFEKEKGLNDVRT